MEYMNTLVRGEVRNVAFGKAIKKLESVNTLLERRWRCWI